MTLDDRQLNIDCTNEVIRPGFRKTVPKEGMPTKTGGKGDLLIEFKVQFPTSLNETQKQKIKDAQLKFSSS